MIAAEGDVEGVADRRRERQRVHEVVGRADSDILDRRPDVGVGAEVKTSEPCASPARRAGEVDCARVGSRAGGAVERECARTMPQPAS